MGSLDELDGVSSDIYSVIRFIHKNKLSIDNDNIKRFYKPTGGYIYCLHNEMFDFYGPNNVFKLGNTRDLMNRMSGYTTSYIKGSTYMVTSKLLCDKNLAEKLLFDKLGQYRIDRGREFFKCNLDNIKGAFQEIECFFTEHDTKDKIIDYMIMNFKPPVKKKKKKYNKVLNLVYSELYYIYRYHQDILTSNYIYHFNRMLLEKGSNISVYGDCDKEYVFTEDDIANSERIRNKVIDLILNNESTNKQLERQITDRLKIIGLSIEDIKHNGDYLKIVTDERKFRSFMQFTKVIQDDGTHKGKFVEHITNEFSENYMNSTISKVLFCRKLEKLLNIRVLEHDNDIIKRRMNETVNYDSNKILSLYHKLFEKTEKSKLPNNFIGYYKLLVSCYRNLISHDLFEVHTKKIRINKKQTKVFDKIIINNAIMEQYLELYRYMYPFYYNVHDDIVNTFNLIKLPKMGKVKIISSDDPLINNGSAPLLEKILDPDYNEKIINKYIDEIYMFKIHNTYMSDVVDYLEQLMNEEKTKINNSTYMF